MKYILILFILILIIFFISLFMLLFSLKRDFIIKPKVEIGNNDIDRETFDLCYIGDSKTQQRFERLSEEKEIISDDNLKLKAWFLKNDSHKYIIICHGYSGDHKDMIVSSLEYYDEGFNVLCPDARAHGESEGIFRGMGYLERKDIKKWMNTIIENDNQAQIVLYGVSMGAATVMMTMCYYHPENLKCVIEDCGYGSVWEQFKSVAISSYHMPSFPVINIASLLSKYICKYDFKQTSIYEKIKENEVPCLFIHGQEDDFVPYRFMDELYNNDSGPKEKYTVKGANHALSKIIDPEGYKKATRSFINKYISD